MKRTAIYLAIFEKNKIMGMPFTISSTASVYFLGFILVFIACGVQTQNEKDAAQNIDSIDLHTEGMIKVKAFPVPHVYVEEAAMKFTQRYRCTTGSSLSQLRVALSSLNTLFQNLGPNEGCVFQYGFSSDTQNICYLVGLGAQNPAGNYFTNRPFPISGEVGFPHYLLIDGRGTSGVSTIHADSLKILRDRYRTIVEYKNGSGNWERIKLNNEHPRMVFHESAELNKFKQTYAQQIPTHLYIRNGMVRKNGGVTTRYHQPILMFGDQNAPFELDPNPSSPSDDYTGKALNAGHVCPPHCNAIEYERDDIN